EKAENVKDKAEVKYDDAKDWTKDKYYEHREDVKDAAHTVSDKTKDATKDTREYAAKKGHEASNYISP
ncbi:hypothetical protein Leryth_026496, partial [Lithospermum erythrorhizon]